LPNVQAGQAFGFSMIATFERGHNVHMLFAGLVGVMPALIKHGNQGGAGREVAQYVCEQLIAQALGKTHMKVPQQEAALSNV
jgi:hypothetical protein